MPKVPKSPNHSEVILVLDASSTRIQVGLLQNNQWLAFQSSSYESLQAIFFGVQTCLNNANKALDDLTFFVFCEGPGSLLGIRVIAMALKAWTSFPNRQNIPIYSYNSLAVSYILIQKFNKPQKDFKVISPLTKDTFLVALDPHATKIEQVSFADLSKSTSQLWYFSFKKLGAQIPQNSFTFDYNLEKIPDIFLSTNILKQTNNPDALLLKQHNFVKWSGGRHKQKTL